MKFLLSIIILIVTPLLVYSQDINGRIIDSENNPIISAYMLNSRSMEQYHTNELGNFKISDAEIGDIISISYLGYETFGFVISGFDEEIEIELQESEIQLSEIVVNQNRNQTSILSSIDVILNPVKSSQELLRKVPGLSFEAGRFNTLRSAALLNLVKTDHHNLYLASEYQITDGPFESSQDFSRRNIMLKYSGKNKNNSILTVIASNFYSKWDASGQIPVRLVNEGAISRFGAVDDTEGGSTARSNIAINFTQPIDNNTFIKSSVFYSRYNFELYSNFTFFLEDPINGDQIRQKEDRNIWGLQSVWHHGLNLDHGDANVKIGVGGRFDQVSDNELSYTKNRTETINMIQYGDVDEENI